MDGGTWWATVHGVTKSQIRLSDFTQDSVSHSLMPTLCNYSLLSSSVNGILQARILAAAAAKSLQSCPTLCDPIDGSPPGSPIPGIPQARTLEWVAIAFSNAWKWKVKMKSLSHVWLLVTPWTAAHQAPPSMGFSRQEYWTGVPLPSPRILEWVAIPFSRGYFWDCDLTQISCLAGRFFTIWATRGRKGTFHARKWKLPSYV